MGLRMRQVFRFGASSLQGTAFGAALGSLLWVSLCGTAVSGTESPPCLQPSDCVIATSRAMPTVNESVLVEIWHEERIPGEKLEITSTQGTTSLKLDAEGRATWTPSEYGEHLLCYGSQERTVWVVSRPLLFNWWSTETRPRHITSSMVPEEEEWPYWKRRGITRLHWIGGAHLADEKRNDPYMHPRRWFQDWWSRLEEISKDAQQGVCLDELYATDERVDGFCIPRAVGLLRKHAGPGFRIGVYYSGIEKEFATGMWYLREAEVVHLAECYWGSESLYRKRWNDVSMYRMQDRACLVISPGFHQSERVKGSQTEEELVGEFAMVRRVAPDAAGLGVFNAYKRHDLERLADALIEPYFLRAVLHLRPHKGGLLARNIGQEDMRGPRLTFLNAKGKRVGSVKLPQLKPWEEKTLEVPTTAVSARVRTPKNQVKIYPGGVYRFPSHMNPIEVLETSVKDRDVVQSEDAFWSFGAVFNRPVLDAMSHRLRVTLEGVLTGEHQGLLGFSAEGDRLSVLFNGLPSDFYTLRLWVRDKTLLGAVHFRLDVGGEIPVLPLPGEMTSLDKGELPQ